MKAFFNRLRKTLASFILRRPLMDIWLRFKIDKLIQKYCRLLIKVPTSTPITIPIPHGQLNRILFIADAMWEKRELLPELSRICEVVFIDAHAHKEIDSSGFSYLPPTKLFTKLHSLETTSFDCIIVYLESTLQSQELIAGIRQRWSCPLVGLNLDCKVNYADYGLFRARSASYKEWAGYFDCNLTNARAMVDIYNADGFPCLYLPTGFHFDPDKSKRPVQADFSIPISFVGSCKPERRAVVDKLRSYGIDVQVFGGGWENRPFTNDAWRVFQKTQINLGIGYNVPDTRITNLKNRDFECPGSGGCYLTTYDWELADLYEVGREILCYRGMDDFPEVYSYYRRRPQECLSIAQAGYDRCIRDHTWEQRFRKVFFELGLI